MSRSPAGIPVVRDGLPSVTTDQMIEVDRAMIEDYGIELIQMMENAGRNLAHLCRQRFLSGDPRDKAVIVLAGRGGNGGGSLVAARRLANWGVNVVVVIATPADAFEGVPAHQLGILQRMSVPVLEAAPTGADAEVDLVIDGLIGYSLSGPPRGATADLIRWANEQAAPVLSLDAPSGLDTASGTLFEPAIHAAATMTLALPKRGLAEDANQEVVGELYLADISVPPALYDSPRLGLEVGNIFADADIVLLRGAQTEGEQSGADIDRFTDDH